MPNKNMKIWETLSKTNPEYTKQAPSSYGKRITTIDPMYQIQMMTDLFGPVGLGWKYKVDYKYIDGLVFAEVTIKYFTNEWHEYGPVCSVQNLSKSNSKLDDEAPKKAMTDAMTKAFSHLGMSADVFLGKFDDSKYVEQMKEEFSQPQPKEIPQAKLKPNGTAHANVDMDIDVNQVREIIKEIDNIYGLRKFRKDNPDLFDPNNNLRVYRQITDIYETHETKLNQQGVTQ